MHTRVLIIPGLFNSGPRHWQTLLEHKYSYCHRIIQDDWSRPDLLSWKRNVLEVIEGQTAPVVLVAHSFGCLVTASLFAHRNLKIKGALMVAPASPAHFNLVNAMPFEPLPFHSTLVSSRNDDWCASHEARFWADTWGSEHIDLGEAKHINVDAGFGHWPLAEEYIESLVDK